MYGLPRPERQRCKQTERFVRLRITLEKGRILDVATMGASVLAHISTHSNSAGHMAILRPS